MTQQNMPPEEVWRDIPGYAHYQASNLGRVKRLACLDARGGRLKEKVLVVSVQRYDKVGHLRSFVSIGLGRNRICECLSVGRAVLLAFEVPPIDSKFVCRHLDDNIRNNTLVNLKWGTQKENIHDAIRNGIRTTYGEGAKGSKLKTLDVIEIRDLYGRNPIRFGVDILAKRYGVHSSTIQSVVDRKNWQHVE